MPFTEVLRQSELSLTRGRIRLLEVLSVAANPLSEAEIEQFMKGECNRTTIYRNLTVLVNKGLVQRILADDAFKYKLISSSRKNKHSRDHVHFKCTRCNQILCLEDLMVNDFVLPEGFRKTENQFLILGYCKDCNHD